MRILKYFVIAALFTSCISQKKAERWMDEHPTVAAGYCADHYPPDTIAKKESKGVDSSGYKEANQRLSSYADSLFYRLDSLQHVPPTSTQPCPPPVNLDSLRKEVNREIKKRTAPCVDSIIYITNTVVDRARETQLRGTIEQKDQTITARDKRISDLEAKVKARGKWIWMFWILLGLVGLATFLKIKGKLPI